MVLDSTKVVDGACAMLREQGFGGLSMRRLAQDLGVRPGALYYHVREQATTARRDRHPDPRQRAADHLGDRRPAGLVRHPGRTAGRRATGPRSSRSRSPSGPTRSFPSSSSIGCSPTGIRPGRRGGRPGPSCGYVLGFVAEEQNYAELVGTAIVGDPPARADETDDAFAFGVEAVVNGLESLATT